MEGMAFDLACSNVSIEHIVHNFVLSGYYSKRYQHVCLYSTFVNPIASGSILFLLIRCDGGVAFRANSCQGTGRANMYLKIAKY